MQKRFSFGFLTDHRQSILKGIKSFAFWLGLTALFIIVIGGLSGLNSGTQTYHLFFGEAAAGKGELASDWFYQTKNPWELFAFLVQFTFQYLGEPFFYIYQVFLVFIYLYSLVGIADHFFNIRQDRLVFFIFLTIYLISYSVFWPDQFGYVLYSGVATQEIPFDRLIPNSFGAFLVLSIYMFIKQKPFASILSIAVACYFHPSYLIAGASLVTSYLLVMYLDGKKFKQLGIFAVSALLVVLPVVVYFYSINSGATPEQIQQAANITAGFRIPQHTHVEVWWDKESFIRLLIVLIALVAARKNRLFYILLVGLLFVAVPTIILAIHPSNILGALMLWRPSAVLVPLATTTLIASWVANWYKDNQTEINARWRWVVISLTALLLIMLVEGIHYQQEKIEMFQARQDSSLFKFVSESLQPGDQYLLPYKDGYFSPFRIETGAPVFVDWRLHPWGALDALKWYGRIQLVEAFYSQGNANRCNMLPDLVENYGVTDVIMPNSIDLDCPGWGSIYQDNSYHIFSQSGELP